jgi:hypothetical protein
MDACQLIRKETKMEVVHPAAPGTLPKDETVACGRET